MSKEYKNLVAVLTELRDVAVATGDRFGVDKLNRCFFDYHEAGTFKDLTDIEQIHNLSGGILAVYVGRGERIWAYIDRGDVPEGFAEKLEIAVLNYFLTLDTSDEHKQTCRNRIVQLLEM